MRKLLLVIVACLLLGILHAAFPVNAVIKLNDSNQIQHTTDSVAYLGLNNQKKNSTKKQKKKLKHNNLFKKISSFYIQHKLIKPTTGKKSDFNLGGLLLGILLAPVGVAIAYLATKNKNVRKWAVIGCVTDIGLGILLLLVLVTFVLQF